MTDQGPPGSVHVTKMTEQVPHKEGLKISGLSDKELENLDTAYSLTFEKWIKENIII
jgi:hypothetical protein